MMITSHSFICYGIILIIICVLFCESKCLVVISVFILTSAAEIFNFFLDLINFIVEVFA